MSSASKMLFKRLLNWCRWDREMFCTYVFSCRQSARWRHRTEPQ